MSLNEPSEHTLFLWRYCVFMKMLLKPGNKKANLKQTQKQSIEEQFTHIQSHFKMHEHIANSTKTTKKTLLTQGSDVYDVQRNQ